MAKIRSAGGLQSAWSSIVVHIVTKDNEPPVIEHTPIREAWEGDTITINANITDNVGVKSATLYYRQKGNVNWISVPMQNSSIHYSATIPSKDVVKGTLEYYIEAEDYSANNASSPSTGVSQPYEILVKSRPEASAWLSNLPIILILILTIIIMSIILLYLRRNQRKKKQEAPLIQDEKKEELQKPHRARGRGS
jgi:ATP-dependent Zn protease